MKYFFLLILIVVLTFNQSAIAQKIGDKKSATLQLKDYSCGDNCYIEFKDVYTGESYDFHNIDDKTDDDGILSDISNEYDAIESGTATGEMRSIGKLYNVEFEYKKVRKWVETEYGPKESKKWTKTWIMKRIRKLNWK
jgi:hypothetical protein